MEINFTIRMDSEDRARALAALEAYEKAGMGEPQNRDATIHALALGVPTSAWEYESADDIDLRDLQEYLRGWLGAVGASVGFRGLQDVNTLLAALWFKAGGPAETPEIRLFRQVANQYGIASVLNKRLIGEGPCAHREPGDPCPSAAERFHRLPLRRRPAGCGAPRRP